jgi:hypothetical protein
MPRRDTFKFSGVVSINVQIKEIPGELPMSLNVANCKRCNRIFQRRLGELCADCLRQQDEQCSRVCQALLDSAREGGVALEDLAALVEVATEDIEKLYMEGRLGNAGVYLKKPCHACGVLTGETERKGRYCLKCSEQTANKAGVEVKPIHELRDEEEKRRRLPGEEPAVAAVKSPVPARGAAESSPRKFGFTVRGSG